MRGSSVTAPNWRSSSSAANDDPRHSFASCLVTIPLLRLQPEKLIRSSLVEAGFKRWPLSFTAGSALQLVQWACATVEVPRDLIGLCYADDILDRGLKPEARTILGNADIILFETTTPVEFVFRGTVLNATRLTAYIKDSVGADKHGATAHWLGHFYSGADGDEAARTFISALGGVPDGLLRDLIVETRSRRVTVADIERSLRAIGEAIPNVPIGIMLPPDGPKVPKGIRQMTIDAAAALNARIYDGSRFVEAHGAASVMAPDGLHFNEAFYEPIAHEYLAFIAGVIGRKRFNQCMRPHGMNVRKAKRGTTV